LGASAVAEPAPVHILVDAPLGKEVVRNQVHQAPIRGTAVAASDGPAAYDVMLVLDISGSTAQPSGVDVDGDSEVGVNPSRGLDTTLYPDGSQNTDPGDSILAAEVAAADALVATLSRSERVRVGVLSFSGEMNPQTGYSDFASIRARLPAILARGPYGGTNFAAGLRLAIQELAGLSGARSTARPEARKVVLFLTDGVPTFPIGTGANPDPGDIEAALSAARLARRAGITVHTYGLGPKALENPYAVTEVARLTVGAFLPVQNPGDIVSFLQAASLANVDDVVFTNLTTREVSYDVNLSPDGSFSGFVPVREGRNRVRITALASDGGTGSVEFDVDFETSGRPGGELALELERIRERNKQLMLLIDNDNVKRFRERQRKQLEIEAGPPIE
jgi:Mg-chelatase subunit ChlD